MAALGSDSFGELVEAAERHCEHAGSLLCAAVYQGSLSMTGLLLDLQDATGYVQHDCRGHTDCLACRLVLEVQQRSSMSVKATMDAHAGLHSVVYHCEPASFMLRPIYTTPLIYPLGDWPINV